MKQTGRQARRRSAKDLTKVFQRMISQHGAGLRPRFSLLFLYILEVDRDHKDERLNRENLEEHLQEDLKVAASRLSAIYNLEKRKKLTKAEAEKLTAKPTNERKSPRTKTKVKAS